MYWINKSGIKYLEVPNVSPGKIDYIMNKKEKNIYIKYSTLCKRKTVSQKKIIKTNYS